MADRQALQKALPETVQGAPEDIRTAFTAAFSLRNVDKATALVRAGERWRTMIFIEEGLLRLFYSDAEGREFNKGFFLEGSLVLPMAPSAQTEPSLFTVATLEPCKLWVADYWRCRRLLESSGLWPAFALPFAEWLADEKFKREYEFLVFSPEKRHRRFSQQHPTMTDRIPDYHLASYLGMSPVSYSRIKRRGRQ